MTRQSKLCEPFIGEGACCFEGAGCGRCVKLRPSAWWLGSCLDVAFPAVTRVKAREFEQVVDVDLVATADSAFYLTHACIAYSIDWAVLYDGDANLF